VVAACADGHLVGLATIERLLAVSGTATIGEVMDPDPPAVAPGTDQEHAALDRRSARRAGPGGGVLHRPVRRPRPAAAVARGPAGGTRRRLGAPERNAAPCHDSRRDHLGAPGQRRERAAAAVAPAAVAAARFGGRLRL